MKKVSVIIPVYNAEVFLRECLDSVTGQTLEDIEVICVDDASRDGSPLILEEYAAGDDRIRVIGLDRNRFAGAARNIGLAAAKGEFLVFLDADDFFEPDMLEKMYDKCREDRADICICGGRAFDMATGKSVPADFYLDKRYLPGSLPFAPKENPGAIFQICNTAPWNKMFRRDFIVREKLKFQETKRSNDLYFVFMALALANGVTAVDDEFVNYRRGTSTSLQETTGGGRFDFYRSLRALKNGLKERGLFRLYKKSYEKKARIIWKYSVGRMLKNCLGLLSAAGRKRSRP